MPVFPSFAVLGVALRLCGDGWMSILCRGDGAGAASVCTAKQQCPGRLCRAEQSPLCSATTHLWAGIAIQPTPKCLTRHQGMRNAWKGKKIIKASRAAASKLSVHPILDCPFLQIKQCNPEIRCFLTQSRVSLSRSEGLIFSQRAGHK